MAGLSKDTLSNVANKMMRSARHFVRRSYLRKGIKAYGDYRSALTKAQKKEAKAYWKRYTNHFTPLWHAFYTAKTGIFDVRYIPEDIMFTEIEEYLNDWNSSRGIDNKCNYEMYFPDICQPKTLFRRMRGVFHAADYSIISREQAIQNCIAEGHLIVKYAVESGRGGGVFFWKTEDGIQKLEKIVDGIKGDAIAQAIIEQHPIIDALHHESINCIRVVTLMMEQGVEYICSYFRMGQGANRIDWYGGCSASIKPDGSLMPVGVDNMTCNPVEAHACGTRFDGFIIPGFEKIKKTAMKMHERLGDFRIASWDFSLSPEEEPIFIEVNLKYGGTKYHQLGQGPLFGDRTEEILKTVYGK